MDLRPKGNVPLRQLAKLLYLARIEGPFRKNIENQLGMKQQKNASDSRIRMKPLHFIWVSAFGVTM